MFNIFKWLQLEPPKLTRKEVEDSRTAPDKDAYDAVQSGIKKGCMIAAENILREGLDKANQALFDMVEKNQIKIPVKFPSGVYKPPKFQTIKAEIPEFDYKMMKQIRINMASGIHTHHMPIDFSGYDDSKTDEVQYKNAEILNEFYGLSKDEIFELTGCYLKE